MLKSIITRILPLVATLCLCLTGILLGNWQTRRAEEKESLAEQIKTQKIQVAVEVDDAASYAQLKPLQKIQLKGQFVATWPLYLDNRPIGGVAGFYVLMPFKLKFANQYILVARGWIPRDPSDRTKIPPLQTPEGEIQIQGMVRDHLDRTMQLGNADVLKPGAIVQTVSIPSLSQQTQLHLLDRVVEQTSDLPDGLSRKWPELNAGADKHRAYAFQWYGLALMAAIFFVVTRIRRGKNRN
ncbi:SURF1 family protein [Undibacterium fentianense]|uniref:SURF1-like protein n=1 Tax=Undibacterium fentianense TaxID=2828728 RepID=A0A941IFV6_9BURK|nr:SURF1 family protein [Undibacterium fentianense]MBR7800747.1 SURF1 family protein [Undibacterium fentianense]